MSTPGWYPDPGGRSGHYRFWDGQTWAPTTTTELPGGPPGGPTQGSPGATPPPGRRRARWVVAGAVLLVVLVVVGALVVRDATRRTVDQGPAPTATSGGNDSSAAQTASPAPSPSPTPTPTPRPSPRVSQTGEPCPIGNPSARQSYPRDGRVHGGSLSFPQQPGWTDPGQQSDGFTWAYDVGETDRRIQPQWFASYAVGAVSVADGFEDPRSGAALAMSCTVSSTFYQNVVSRTDLVDESTTVDGYRAWTIRAEIRVDDPRTTFEGDTVQVTVVDLDSPEALAFFWGCAPIGDRALTAQLDRVVKQLRVG